MAFELRVDRRLVASVIAGALMLVFGIAMMAIGATVAQTTLSVGNLVVQQLNQTAPTKYNILSQIAGASQSAIGIIGLTLTIAGLVVILLPFLSMIPWREIFRGD